MERDNSLIKKGHIYFLWSASIGIGFLILLACGFLFVSAIHYHDKLEEIFQLISIVVVFSLSFIVALIIMFVLAVNAIKISFKTKEITLVALSLYFITSIVTFLALFAHYTGEFPYHLFKLLISVIWIGQLAVFSVACAVMYFIFSLSFYLLSKHFQDRLQNKLLLLIRNRMVRLVGLIIAASYLFFILFLVFTSGSFELNEEARPKKYSHAAAYSTNKGIYITDATYGLNCQTAFGNVTLPIANACNSKTICEYKIQTQVLGDPALNCAKDFRLTFYCGTDALAHHFFIPAEADQQTFILSCEEPVRAATLKNSSTDNGLAR